MSIDDRITAFCASWWFFLVNIIWWALQLVVIEPKPWPTFTMELSLEAIFIGFFIMRSQAKQAERDREAQRIFDEHVTETLPGLACKLGK